MTVSSDAAPKILDLPVGLQVEGKRREFDSLGVVEVPADRYRGAQTSAASSSSRISR
jgi:fumarate hydratase, class II